MATAGRHLRRLAAQIARTKVNLAEIRAAQTTTPEQTLADAGISTKRRARYQRRMSSLLAGRERR